MRGIPGNPGHFKMHFVNLRSGVHEKISLPIGVNSSRRRYVFSMTEAAGVTVDLDNGSILIHPENPQGEAHLNLHKERKNEDHRKYAINPRKEYPITDITGKTETA